MGRSQVSVLVGMMMIIAGCAAEESPPVVVSPSPSPAASPAPTPGLIAPAGQSPNAQPLTAQQPNTPPAVPGLIPSTNPQERTDQVKSEIKTNELANPFAALPPAPPKGGKTGAVPKVAQLPQADRPGPTQPAGPSKPANADTPTIPKIQAAPLGVKLPPVVPPQVGFGPGGVAAPVTDTARAVEVTGVVMVGRSPQAIVVAPGDATSRYVSPGQRISGGKVLVKRIEVPPNGDPVVILEENGVEVAKSVGEKALQADDKAPKSAPKPPA